MNAHRGIFAALVAGGLLLGFAGPGSAGLPDAKIKIAEEPEGPYNVLGVRLDINDGDTQTAYLKVKSNDEHIHAVTLHNHALLPLNWRAKYFNKNGVNISQEVFGGGYEFNAKPNKSKRFELRVTRGNGSAESGCLNTELETTTGNPVVRTAVNREISSC